MTIEEVEIAAPGPGEVLVEVRASGICHSDFLASRTLPPGLLPIILGHEVAGVVLEVGPGVRRLTPGDHVVACEVSHCGHCVECISGRPARCIRTIETERQQDADSRLSLDGKAVAAFSHIGGFAERILLHPNNLAIVPKELPFDRAAVLGCAVATGAGAAINTASVRVGDTVAVFGCGGVGLSALQGAALAGARRVIAIDIQLAKLDLARRFGATDTIDASDTDAVTEVLRLTDGIGVDYAFEAAGVTSTARQAIAATRPTGTTFLIGMQSPGTILEFDVFQELMLDKKSIHSVYMGSTNPQRDIPLYAELYLQGRFNLDDLVSRHVSLDDLEEGFASFQNGSVARTVVTSFR
ncbi:zinc-binding dehydrogenase [Leifsonia kafniensis]